MPNKTTPLIDMSAKYLTRTVKSTAADRENESETVPFVHFKHITIENLVSKGDSKKINKSLLEDADQILYEHPKITWHKINDNKHIGKTSDSISTALSKHARKIKTGSKDHRAIESYTHSSKDLNEHLLRKRPSASEKSFYNPRAKHLHYIVSTPLGHDVHLYSGVNSDPRKWEKNSQGHTRLRAFTSMTHDKKIAHYFAHKHLKAKAFSKNKNVHIIHLHAKATDYGMNVRKHSAYKEEHETILPADTYIKPHPKHKTPEIYHAPDGSTVHIHHYVIHKQTHPDNYEPHSK